MKDELLKNILLMPKNERIEYIGEQMFIFATEKGFPPEMFKDELLKTCKITKEEIPSIVNIYQIKLVKHKLKSGMKFLGKTHKQLQEYNKKILKEVLLTGDFNTI